MSADRLRDAEAQLHAWVQERELGASVLLTQDGETLLETCVGYADRASRTPVSPATRFGLASVTKLFTAVAVADLVAQGLVDFDTPVVDVLPPERRPSTLRPDVTVHHLLSHTSQIADYFEEDPDEGPEPDYADLWTELPTYAVNRPADFLPLFGDLPAYGPPGGYRYSNAGYIVLGLLIEELTGTAYADHVQERVLDRAGMTSSGFFRLDEVLPDIATGYVRRDDGTWRTNIFSLPPVGGADGGAMATARDLDLFLTAYDESLLGDLHDVVLAPHADAGDGFTMGYGVIRYPDGRFGHGGGDPGVDVLIARWPEERANLVVLTNVEDDAYDHAYDVRELVLAAWRATS